MGLKPPTRLGISPLSHCFFCGWTSLYLKKTSPNKNLQPTNQPETLGFSKWNLRLPGILWPQIWPPPTFKQPTFKQPLGIFWKMDVSENSGFSPQIIHFNKVFGFSIINHPFWGTTIFGNTQMIPKKHGLGFLFFSHGWYLYVHLLALRIGYSALGTLLWRFDSHLSFLAFWMQFDKGKEASQYAQKRGVSIGKDR